MGRNDYNYGSGKMGRNKDQNQMVRDAAREVGVDPQKLSELVHQEKDNWYNGDYSYSYLIDLAKELKKKG